MEGPISIELVDRLSALPENLIHHILSSLPMRDVVATTFLSKWWNGLWKTVPYLNFSVDVSRDDRDDEAFVNNVLMMWEGARILKFEVCYEPHFYIKSAADLDSWVNFALEREVEDLSIDLSYDIKQSYWYLMNCEKDVYWVKQSLYACSSLRKLRLVGCNLGTDGYPSWDKLESLVVEGFYVSERAINDILFGCPRLEVVEVCHYERYDDLNLVSSTSLREIKMKKQLCNSDESWNYPVLKTWCPNLATMKVSRGVFYMDDKEKDLALHSWFM